MRRGSAHTNKKHKVRRTEDGIDVDRREVRSGEMEDLCPVGDVRTFTLY